VREGIGACVVVLHGRAARFRRSEVSGACPAHGTRRATRVSVTRLALCGCTTTVATVSHARVRTTLRVIVAALEADASLILVEASGHCRGTRCRPLSELAAPLFASAVPFIRVSNALICIINTAP
jgi:hypothetical protein